MLKLDTRGKKKKMEEEEGGGGRRKKKKEKEEVEEKKEEAEEEKKKKGRRRLCRITVFVLYVSSPPCSPSARLGTTGVLDRLSLTVEGGVGGGIKRRNIDGSLMIDENAFRRQ